MTKRDVTVYPGEEKAQGAIMNMWKYMKGECKENGADSFQWCPVTERQQAQTKT